MAPTFGPQQPLPAPSFQLQQYAFLVQASSSLTAPFPVLSHLQNSAQRVLESTHDPALKIAWCRDVFLLVDRASGALSSTVPPIGPVFLTDTALDRLAHTAIPVVLQLATSHNPTNGKMPPHVAEAIAMRAGLAASGAFPGLVGHNPRAAFREFEAAAKGKYAGAWFRLGTDYETFNDHSHAKDCFVQGSKLNVESCLYRLGMAHLLGQLSLTSHPPTALPLLHRAALLASLTCPQPAYVFALLLLSEFTQITVPPSLLVPFIPPGSSPTLEARKHLERAAYLHFGPAQCKLGRAYKFAEPPFSFDPVLSAQYYFLASQLGEAEADMALSRWFLRGSAGALAPAGHAGGSPGGFPKDEGLALMFAEKAAHKGLPNAEFAMGHYAEVGVGQPRDLGKATDWYQLAKSHGNTDAITRLQVLSQPAIQEPSRQERDGTTEVGVVNRGTQDIQRAGSSQIDTHKPGPELRGRPDGLMVVDVIRKSSLDALPIEPEATTAGGRGRVPAPRRHSPPPVQQPAPSPPKSGGSRWASRMALAIQRGPSSQRGGGTGWPQGMGSPARRTPSPALRRSSRSGSASSVGGRSTRSQV